jgi:phosphonate transport system substrate-binding protein
MKVLLRMVIVIALVLAMSLLAGCYKEEITIIFDARNELGEDKVNFEEGSLIIEPAEPTFYGYIFLGWYSDYSLQNEFDFNTKATEAITLYAKWEEITVVYTYDTNEGELIEPLTISVLCLENGYAIPVKLGHSFIGWFDENLENEYIFTDMPGIDTTMYAKWEINQYTIIFHTNSDSEISDIVQDYNTVALEPTNPVNADYEFLGWYTDLTFENLYDFDTPLTEDIILYAKWGYRELTITFVPSRPADEILTITAPLAQMLKEELEGLGFFFDEININVAASYEGAVMALILGDSGVAFLPAGTLAIYLDSEEIDVILSAARYGLTKDYDDAIDWNDDLPTLQGSSDLVTYYRGLIVAGPSAKGRELAEKINAGIPLTWEDVSTANWCVRSETSSSGYIYPNAWLIDNFDGKDFDDIDSNNVINSGGYGISLSYLASGNCDIATIYSDARMHYDDDWTFGYGRTLSIWEEVDVIGVTYKIMNDTISISTLIVNEALQAAIQTAFMNIIETPEGLEIMSVYSHTGYEIVTKDDYILTKHVIEISD